MPSIFSKIIDGQVPGEILLRDERCAVLLDIEPLTPGHALVVPRAEIDHWLDLPPDLLAHLMSVAARVGRAQQSAFGSSRVGMIIQGFEVPHAHLHVFPADRPEDFELARRARRSPEQLAADADALRAALGPHGG